jgi:PKD repeat protein
MTIVKTARILDKKNLFSLNYLALSFLLILFIMPNPVAATDYFVATTGHNNDTGDVTHPWATLVYAVANIKAGDTINIYPGSYSDSGITTVPTSSGKITKITGYNGYPTFDSGSKSGWLISLTGANGVEIDNINITGYGNPIVFTQCRNAYVKNCYIGNCGADARTFEQTSDSGMWNCTITGTGWDSIYTEGTSIVTSNITIDGCRMTNSLSHDFIDFQGDCRNCRVTNNTLSNCGYEAIYVHQTSTYGYPNAGWSLFDNNTIYDTGSAITFDNTFNNSIISNNKIHDLRTGIYVHGIKIASQESDNLTIRDNYLYGTMYSSALYLYMKNSLVSNNTINCPGVLPYIFYGKHNILYKGLSPSGSYTVESDGWDTGGVTIRYPLGMSFSLSSGTPITDSQGSYYTFLTGTRTVTYSGSAKNDPPSYIYPIANFNSNVTTGNASLSVKFTDLSINSNGWNWNFGDGASSTQQSPTHIYTVAGTYTVTLTASNANGTNSKSATITVSAAVSTTPNPIPVAAFSVSPTSGVAPLNVAFTDKSTNSPTAWNWSFGDGAPNSTEKNPAHTYAKAGKYTVSLTVSNAAGSNKVVKPDYITVNALKPPVAAFSASPLSGKKPLTTKFTDKSAGSITSRSWNFGDKSTSTAKNPTHKYSNSRSK